MLKVKDFIPFSGKISQYSPISPLHGGKPFILEVEIDSGEKAYIADWREYTAMGFPNGFTPDKPGQLNEAYSGQKVQGEYWVYEGRNIIVSISYVEE